MRLIDSWSRRLSDKNCTCRAQRHRHECIDVSCEMNPASYDGRGLSLTDSIIRTIFPGIVSVLARARSVVEKRRQKEEV
jgi:hypothetical protein